MKIRHILLALTVFLGLALVVAVGVQIRTEVLEYLEAQRLAASNAVREDLLLAAGGIANERSSTYALLLEPERRTAGRERMETARHRVDETRGSLDILIRGDNVRLSNETNDREVLGRIWRDLQKIRTEADAALLGAAEDAPRYALRWFQEATRLINEAESLRLRLLNQDLPRDPVLRSKSLLRYYSGLLSESIAQNEALLTQALSGRAGLGIWEVETASRNAGRSDLAWHLIREQLQATVLSQEARALIASAEEHHLSALGPLQQTLLGSLRGRAWASITPEQWSGVAGQALGKVADVQRQLLDSSRERVDTELERAWRSVVLWSLLLVAGSVAVAASTLVVRNRIVLPLEALSRSMLRIADNDLTTPLPRYVRADEIGEMSDSLRVFKANAARRQRLEQDKQALHARLREAYGQLRRDLEAAALIQTSLLPRSSMLRDVRFQGLYRPSSVIAGDTYNVVERSQGRVGFFQLDVAGHGAPAALVSVASHHALSQALLKHSDSAELTEVAEQINAEWSGDLPYFTMILGEIDLQANRATLVQAGHPPPILLRPDGTVRLIGDGGFPVGLLTEAAYEAVTLPFMPHDRLVLYSDGLVDAENPEGEPFSDTRLTAVLQDHVHDSTPDLLAALDDALRRWRGSESLEDDVSILVLERVTAEAGRDPVEPKPVRSVTGLSVERAAASHPKPTPSMSS